MRRILTNSVHCPICGLWMDLVVSEGDEIYFRCLQHGPYFIVVDDDFLTSRHELLPDEKSG